MIVLPGLISNGCLVSISPPHSHGRTDNFQLKQCRVETTIRNGFPQNDVRSDRQQMILIDDWQAHDAALICGQLYYLNYISRLCNYDSEHSKLILLRFFCTRTPPLTFTIAIYLGSAAPQMDSMQFSMQFTATMQFTTIKEWFRFGFSFREFCFSTSSSTFEFVLHLTTAIVSCIEPNMRWTSNGILGVLLLSRSLARITHQNDIDCK